MTTLLQDLRFALRQMRRSPGFALAAVVILGLGIAANVIVFGVLQPMILQPLDVPRPEQVKSIARHVGGYPVAAWPEVRDLRDGNTLFTAVAAEQMQIFGLETNGASHPVWGDEVSGQFFEVMAINPALGRLLRRSDDDHPGASEVAVVSWSAWKSYFNGDPKVVGKTIRINKHPYTVIGVTPETFYGTEKFLYPDIFVPMANEASLDGVDWLNDRRQELVFPIVRMKDGVTDAQAQAELDAIAARIQQRYPQDESGLGFKLAQPGLIGDFVGDPARRFLSGIMALAGILLLAACANLGGLFAARTADRAREIAIRMAIGSSRWRVVRQILTEAFVIAIFGGICACVISWITLGALSQWHPATDYPVRVDVQPKPFLIAVAFVVSVIAGALFGVMPLRQIFNADPNDAIKGGGSQSSSGPGWALRDLLLAAQIALCCVTITAAFVSLRGLARSLAIDRGFNPNDTVMAKFDLSQAAYSADAAEEIQKRMLEKISHLPGVQAAAYSNATPLSDTLTLPIFAQETTDFRPTNQAFETFYYNVSPEYLSCAETRLVEGRDIRPTDTARSPLVAVVNRQFARRLFHTEHAVGRRFKDVSGHSIQVVGVVPDGKYFTLSEDPQEAAYFPILQHPGTATSLIVRLRPNSPDAAVNEMASTVRQVVRDIDPAIPIRIASSWKTALAFSLFTAQIATVALGLFGAFGLLLSIAGTFGLASYTVNKRIRELSIRVALGAQARQILSAALGRLMVLLAIGSAAGTLLGVAASQVLSAIVFQASAKDPLVLLAVGLTILLTGVLSISGPVSRALNVDPANVLREQ